MDPRGFPTSLPEFQRVFPDEHACSAYLEHTKWPDGFTCPKCGLRDEPMRMHRPTTVVLRCRGCRSDISLTADTIMERSHTPICLWFWGAYLVVTQTPGQSALQFQRQLGLKRYETAFQMLHKLRAGMVRPKRDLIGGADEVSHVEVDEAYVGGRTRGEGRGVHHKAIVMGAVEVRNRQVSDDERHAAHERGIPIKRPRYAGRLRLQVVSNRGTVNMENFVTGNVAKGSIVRTDGWQGYDGLDELGYDHDPLVLGGSAELAEEHLPMIHLVFSNLKTWILGTHHGVSQSHLQAYLNEYTFRFNRRFYPFTAFNSVIGIGAHARAPTYRELYDGGWEHPVG